jgi:hypothetical protein
MLGDVDVEQTGDITLSAQLPVLWVLRGKEGHNLRDIVHMLSSATIPNHCNLDRWVGDR